MYDKLIEILEKRLAECTTHWDLEEATKIVNLILNINLIKTQIVNAELIQASRRVSRN